jgi:hypothetical protein
MEAEAEAGVTEVSRPGSERFLLLVFFTDEDAKGASMVMEFIGFMEVLKKNRNDQNNRLLWRSQERKILDRVGLDCVSLQRSSQPQVRRNPGAGATSVAVHCNPDPSRLKYTATARVAR